MNVPVKCPLCGQVNTFKLKTENEYCKFWECQHIRGENKCGHIEIERVVEQPFYDNDLKYDLPTEWDV